MEKLITQVNYYLTEFDILDFFYSFKSTFLDYFMYFFTLMGEHGIFCVALSLLLIAIPRTRRVGLCCLAALVCEFIPVNVILKPLIARTRPIYANTARKIVTFATVPYDNSFPSGHTAASFAVATALFRNNKKVGIPALLTAFMVGISRLYFYVHYPTDVLAGVFFGVLGGVLGEKLITHLYKKQELKKAAGEITQPPEDINDNDNNTENDEDELTHPEYQDV